MASTTFIIINHMCRIGKCISYFRPFIFIYIMKKRNEEEKKEGEKGWRGREKGKGRKERQGKEGR